MNLKVSPVNRGNTPGLQALIHAWQSAVESLLGSHCGGRYKTLMLLHSELVHPEINGILGQAGHHSKVLISDGNYPASSKIGPEAELVSLAATQRLPQVARRSVRAGASFAQRAPPGVRRGRDLARYGVA